jgi:hypothetical protein
VRDIIQMRSEVVTGQVKCVLSGISEHILVVVVKYHMGKVLSGTSNECSCMKEVGTCPVAAFGGGGGIVTPGNRWCVFRGSEYDKYW